MTPLVENRHVERCLSLIIILYGLRWIIPAIGAMIQWMPFWGNPYYSYNSWYVCAAGLSQVIVGCWLLIFFSVVVQWIGYFATREYARSKRCWSVQEILALPLILWAFTELVYIFYCTVDLLIVLVYYGGDLEAGSLPLWLVVVLLYPTAVFLFLFYVRPITIWLLRRTEPQS
ncbi:MAG: hypothetical protein LBI05_08285 [Planctomycetaceae bacterium]|jgi:hypothetical protein|nr:hypothetical protein [Planctomycetaceae bacterium]